MRAILGIILLLIILSPIGWVSFNTSGPRPSATIESEKIEADVDRVSEAARDAINDVRGSDEPATDPASLN